MQNLHCHAHHHHNSRNGLKKLKKDEKQYLTNGVNLKDSRVISSMPITGLHMFR